MFEKFAHSWSLVKASASVLRSDKELLLFPLLSGISCILVAATFLVPAFFSGMIENIDGDGMSAASYVFLFAFYVVQYFVIIFFNSALIGAAMIRLDGGDPTVADGFRIAISKLPTILGYAVIAATVGLILRALEERAGFIGRIVIGFIGLAWTVTSFLVVPVLVSQDIGPVDAVKRSAELLKKTWGQNLIGTAGIGLVFGIGIAIFAVIAFGLIMLAVSSGSVAVIVTALTVSVVALLMVVVIQAALQGIYAAALYRYATEGEAGEGFDSSMVAAAFTAKA